MMHEFQAMRAELEAELIEARRQVTATAADAADAEAARVVALAARDAVQAAVAPLGNKIGSALAERLAAKNREVHAATGTVTRTTMIAEVARHRVADLEASIEQIETISPTADPAKVPAEAAQ